MAAGRGVERGAGRGARRDPLNHFRITWRNQLGIPSLVAWQAGGGGDEGRERCAMVPCSARNPSQGSSQIKVPRSNYEFQAEQ